MKNLWHQIEKLFGIYRWHPTVALQYLPMIAEIKKMRNEDDLDLLEVGSGGLGIAPYIKQRVIGVDIDFSPPIHPQIIPVKTSATHLPFANDSFSVVVSSDMLEHLSQAERTKAIVEMLRVSKYLLCIGVPVGVQAQKQDKILSQLYKKTHHKEFDFFSEHDEFGLPDKEWLQKTILSEAEKLNKHITIKSINCLNLNIRYWLMWGWISDNFLINIFFRKILLLCIPILLHLNSEPTYRQIFFIYIRHD